MKIKKILICLCVIALTGCGTSTQSNHKKTLDGLDGKETYKEVVKIMNEEVQYLQTVTDDNYNIITSEAYKVNNQLCFVSKSVFEEGALHTLSYTITQGTDFHTLFLGMDEKYEYELINDYPQVIETLYIDYLTNDQCQVYDVQRTDKGDTIILTMKLQISETTGGGEDYVEKKYVIDELTVDKNGYVAEEKMTYYTDDQFTTKTEESKTITNSNYNKKTSKDLENEIELMKSCNGLNDAEVKEKLNIKTE